MQTDYVISLNHVNFLLHAVLTHTADGHHVSRATSEPEAERLIKLQPCCHIWMLIMQLSTKPQFSRRSTSVVHRSGLEKT